MTWASREQIAASTHNGVEVEAEDLSAVELEHPGVLGGGPAAEGGGPVTIPIEPRRRRILRDPEVRALRVIAEEIEKFPPETQVRMLAWLTRKYVHDSGAQ